MADGPVDVLLSHGYCLAEDEHEREIMMPYPPLGLLYVSAWLRRSGRSVEVYDTTFGTLDGFAARLARLRPAVVGLYATLMTRGTVLEMLRLARDAGAWVVLGGPEPAPNAAEYLARGAHVVVDGEGEQTMDELVRALPTGGLEAAARVAGVLLAGPDGAIVRTPPRPQLRPVDGLPWPDRDAVDMAAYLDTWKRHHGHSSVSLITSRGCPYTCRWCSHAVFGRTHRRRSVTDVADEVASIVERYAPDRLWYADDVFTLNRPWTVAFAAELRRRGLHVPFECISRADRITPEVADALAGMGCRRLWIGSESGSQRVLDAMGRLTDAADVRAKTRLLQQRGIEVGMFIMLGYEGEEESDLEATVEHLKLAQPDVFLTTVAYPIAGTPYYDEVAWRLRADRPWHERTDRDLRIAGRRSRRYYESATRWMVHEVALERETRLGTAGPLRRLGLAAAAGRGRLGMWWHRRGSEERGLEGAGRGWSVEEAAARRGLE